MRFLSYNERLKRRGLKSLEERRIRGGDLIPMYKVKNGLEYIDWHTRPRSAPHTSKRAESQNRFRLERETFPAGSCNDFRNLNKTV